MKQKKMPMRKCVGCTEMKEKKELVRVVKAPDITDENGEIVQKGDISVDLTGKKPGRGAYVCRDAECLKRAIRQKQLERQLEITMNEEITGALTAEMDRLNAGKNAET